jgi:NitT/TauT family transport system ATP-binding protein
VIGTRARTVADLDAPRVATTTPIVLDGVTKTYGSGAAAVPALDRVGLEVNEQDFLCVVGASGCGKSTLLNLLAGLDRPTSGTSEVTGGTALMFQESALFPWLTVSGNVELALRLRGVARRERKARAAELLDAVHLTGFGDKRPHELSGGMRQRSC